MTDVLTGWCFFYNLNSSFACLTLLHLPLTSKVSNEKHAKLKLLFAFQRIRNEQFVMEDLMAKAFCRATIWGQQAPSTQQQSRS